MPVEMHSYEDGKIMSVTIPVGTQFYSERALKREAPYLGDILRIYQSEGPERLEEVARSHGRDLESAEKALVRLIHTFNYHPEGPSFLIDSLGLTLRKGERYYSGEQPTPERPLYSLLT